VLAEPVPTTPAVRDDGGSEPLEAPPAATDPEPAEPQQQEDAG
jgi:hypothetical protein